MVKEVVVGKGSGPLRSPEASVESMFLSARLRLGGSLLENIGHEVNNLVQGLSSAAYLLEDCAKHGDSVDVSFARDLGAVVDEMEAIGKVTTGFARCAAHPAESIQVKEMIEESVAFLRRVGKLKTVELKVEIDDDLPTMHWRKCELEFLVLALLCHAAEASRLGDRIIGVRLHCSEADSKINLAVFDTITDAAALVEGRSCDLGTLSTMIAARGGTLSTDASESGRVLRMQLPKAAHEQ